MTGVVFEAPLALAPSLEYKPVLAEAVPSFETGSLRRDPFTVEIRLRERAAFSDGEPLTSADVKWTYEQAMRLAQSGYASPLYSGFERLSRVETPGERTVRLVFDEPYGPWRDLLTAPILPRHVYADRNLRDLTLNEDPVGSGPFRLESRTETRMYFGQSPDYWVEEPPLPNLEEIDLRSQPPGEAAEGLVEDRADFGFFVSAVEAPSSGDLLRAAAARVRVELLLFNSRRLEAPSSRKAVSRAVDRPRLASVAGGADVARSFVSPERAPGYVPAWENHGTGSPEESTPPGRVLEIVYVGEGAGATSREDVVEALVSDLSEAGIEVEARDVPPGEFFGEVLSEGEFDLALYTVGAPADYDLLVPNLPTAAGEKLARSLSSLEEEERARYLVEAQESSAGEAALLPLFVWPDTYAWSSTLSGPRPGTPYGGLMWNVREWAFYK